MTVRRSLDERRTQCNSNAGQNEKDSCELAQADKADSLPRIENLRCPKRSSPPRLNQTSIRNYCEDSTNIFPETCSDSGIANTGCGTIDRGSPRYSTSWLPRSTLDSEPPRKLSAVRSQRPASIAAAEPSTSANRCNRPESATAGRTHRHSRSRHCCKNGLRGW